MDETAQSLIAFCRKDGRVCPQPMVWNELYEMLPNKRRAGLGWEPPLPMILAAWWDTPALPKMLRLAEHIGWAEQHGCLDVIADYLRGLREEDGHHFEEA